MFGLVFWSELFTEILIVAIDQLSTYSCTHGVSFRMNNPDQPPHHPTEQSHNRDQEVEPPGLQEMTSVLPTIATSFYWHQLLFFMQ